MKVDRSKLKQRTEELYELTRDEIAGASRITLDTIIGQSKASLATRTLGHLVEFMQILLDGDDVEDALRELATVAFDLAALPMQGCRYTQDGDAIRLDMAANLGALKQSMLESVTRVANNIDTASLGCIMECGLREEARRLSAVMNETDHLTVVDSRQDTLLTALCAYQMLVDNVAEKAEAGQEQETDE